MNLLSNLMLGIGITTAIVVWAAVIDNAITRHINNHQLRKHLSRFHNWYETHHDDYDE